MIAAEAPGLLTILIVDDNPEDRAELRGLLLRTDRRYAFVEAATAADAVRLARDRGPGRPDCVILDYYLPDARGDEVLAQLRDEDGAVMVPVVVLTIGDGPEIGRRSLRAGAEDFVGKASMTADSVSRVVDNAIERWTLARALRASEARFRHLAAAVPQAVWMLDAGGELIYANDRWHAYFGTLADAGVRGDWRAVNHPDDEPVLAQLARDPVRFERDCRLRGADGQYRWHHIVATPIRDAAGNVTRWYGVNTDIHHRKTAEQRLAIEHLVSRILARATSFAEAAPEILRAIATGLAMDVCALWLTDAAGSALYCQEVFDGGAARLRDFAAQTRAQTCALGDQLPGRVWQTLRAQWMVPALGDARAGAAQRAGLSGGGAYPVATGDTLIGVIELFGEPAQSSDEPLVAMMASLGNELGQFILRERAGHMRQALEASRTGIWSWNLVTDAVEWTAECYAIFGIAPGEFPGTGAALFGRVAPDDRPAVEATVRQAIVENTGYTAEYRVVRPSGQAIWVQTRGRATYAVDGTPLRLLGTLTDVDDRKRITEALARSEDRLARGQRAARIGTWDWNIATGEMSWTDEAWRVFRGAPPDQTRVTYERWLASVHPEDRAQAAAALRDGLGAGRYVDQFRVHHADGTIHWVESQAEVVRDAQGAPARLVGTAGDVTERHEGSRALEAALADAGRAIQARDQLVWLVSHDLRNPLGVLSMELSLLGMQAEQAAAPSQHPSRIIERMARQIATMTRTIDNLLDVAALQAGNQPSLDLRATDLVALTHRLAAEFRQATQRHAIDVRSLHAQLIGLWDPDRIERAVANLLSNAVKYSPAGGRVTIEIDQVEPQLAVLRVQDEGIGISLADRDRVFEWFARGENARQSQIRGTGIGLAGVKQIVELHGGSVSVESDVGSGSTFTLSLPLDPRARGRDDAPPLATSSPGSGLDAVTPRR